MRREQLLEQANQFQLEGGKFNDARDVVLERRRQVDESSKWVIKERSAVLNKDAEWEVEPTPSSRDDAFLERTRFDSVDDALAFWLVHKDKV